jgi:Spy/CpxP family protein refolding chaperone
MKILLILALFFSFLFSDDHYEHEYKERHLTKELSHLQLSKKQKHEIKKIIREHRYNLKEYRELKEDIETQKKSFFLDNDLDIKKIEKLNHKLDEKAHTIENSFLKKIHSILTYEQRKRFIYYFEDWEVR